MKKLFKAFKSLPPELRMFLAMAGLASPIGAIYFLRRFFPGVSMLTLILCVAAVVVVIALLVWIITAVFTRGRKKRAKSMAAELANEAQAGPQSVDVSAAIKANNEKFFGAIRDMRKNIGVSIYDLPWYIVIGDSGCGKTKLVNEGGLTFSTGRPEGYQLGTLNYNWWFTEDAIFVDMAGRLCNPQDDSDRREWSAFLDTVAKGRRGFPINGALVCVSAEQLLQDPPEKQEADANTALERLRDLQTKLGVTFATYLVVTKCDKILGFMQFFNRAVDDITIKNQIVGWSKPGDFNELYDPEKFKADFDAVYTRLADLRLRRLNDEEEEIELGLAYSYPEEFRRLCEPLQIYVRMLFPYIRKPRAVKNLIFRGVYFTSATQEGELILKYLTERLGPEAADQFAPLDDLYPNKRPHFIKDVLFKKVFPEHGLVFRNEQQVIRNKKLNKVLKVGTTVLAVVLIAAFWWSAVAFTNVIGAPRQHAEDVAQDISTITAKEALRRAGEVRDHVSTIEDHKFAARVLSIGIGSGKPVRDLERVRVGLVEKTLVEALAEVDEALRSGKRLEEPGEKGPEAYRDALEQYIMWFGCRNATEPPGDLMLEGFETLCKVVDDPDSITNTKQEDFFDEARWYFNAIKDSKKDLKRNPAVLLARAGLNPEDTIRTALLEHVYGHYLDHYATLGQDHGDKNIREWMRIRDQCRTVGSSYKVMLDAAKQVDDVQTLVNLGEFKNTFVEQYGRFDEALSGLSWRGEGAGSFLLNIPSLSSLLKDQRQIWVRYGEQLDVAARTCGLEDEAVIDAIEHLSAGDPPQLKGLDRAFWESLQETEIVPASVAYSASVFEEANFKRYVTEMYDTDSCRELIAFTKGDGMKTADKLQATDNALVVGAYLDEIRNSLAGFDAALPEDRSAETPQAWIRDLRAPPGPRAGDGAKNQIDDLSEYWHPDDLRTLYQRHSILLDRGKKTRVLLTMLECLQPQHLDDWGYARLLPYEDLEERWKAPYSIKPPPRLVADSQRQPAPGTAETPERRGATEESDIFRRRDREVERAEPMTRETRRIGARGPGGVPACVTLEFLSERSWEWALLLHRLRRIDGQYLYESTVDDDSPLHLRCERALEKAAISYMDAYFQSWSEAYRGKKLNELDKLTHDTNSWGELTGMLTTRRTTHEHIAREFRDSLEWILKCTSCATFCTTKGWWWHSIEQPEWRDAENWLNTSRNGHWDEELGLFVYNAKVPFDDPDVTAPWEPIPEDFMKQWLEVAEGIADHAKLPTQFEDIDVDEYSPTGSIPWGQMQKLREKHGLDDERLTRQLVEFEDHAQKLLSVALTECLVGIQKKYFQAKTPRDGWPYLMGEPYSPNALDTVDFNDFKSFLVQVHRADKAFKDHDRTLLKEAPGRKERREFFDRCKDWYEFLGLKDEIGSEEENLRVSIRALDPVGEPYGKETVDDGPQHVYGYFVLDLGLKLDAKDDEFGDGALWIATTTEKRMRERQVLWEWKRGTVGKLWVRLKRPEGGRSPLERELGEASPLAFCAYLHQYGKSYDNGKIWYVTHPFDLEDKPLPDTRFVGERVEFTLDRRLPEPIPKLTVTRPKRTER
ncbi:MAG: type VI secretion protein IcmF/TssM N-terminal domain-containing protein [Phycisphaerae bacterium]